VTRKNFRVTRRHLKVTFHLLQINRRSPTGDLTKSVELDGKFKVIREEKIMGKITPKKALERLEKTEASWQTNAPDATFYGTSLAQYKARVQLSRDARALITSLEQQLSVAIDNRDDIDAENLILEGNIVKGIAGDAEYGDDSALYEGTGRIRKSEKKSGLTRKKKGNDEDE
jgi:hypothetical protein